MTIVVHHLENSRSQRVLWLLEELGQPYEVVRYLRDPQTMLAPPELLAVHPLGKSPVIVDGDLVVAESGAIIEYLADRYGDGALAPAPGTPERLRYAYWLHFAEGSLMPPLVMKLIFHRVETAKAPFFVKPIARAIADRVRKGFIDPNITRLLDFLEHELRSDAWFVGDAFSAADVQMSFPVEAASARGGLDAHTRLAAWLARVHARPAYRRALERGGPYALMAS